MNFVEILSSPRMKSSSEASTCIQSPLIKNIFKKSTDRNSISTCSSNTMQILQEEVNWNSTYSNNNSITSAVLSSQSSCENFRNVEYEFAAIFPSSKQKLHHSDIATKLLIENLYMYIQMNDSKNTINNNNNIDWNMLNEFNSTFYPSQLAYSKNEFKLVENISQSYISQGVFNRLNGVKCNSIQSFKKNKILQINFIQNPQCNNDSQQNIEFKVQERIITPQINSADDHELNQFSLDINNHITDSTNLLNYSNYQCHKSENQIIDLHSLDSSQLIIDFEPISKIFSNKLANDETIDFSCNARSLNSKMDEEEEDDDNEYKSFKTIVDAENWIKLRIKNTPVIQKMNEKNIQKGGSNYFVFQFDSKLKKYVLSRQFLDNEFLELIHSNQEELTYSYLHQEDIFQDTSNKIQQYMQTLIGNAFSSYTQELTTFQNENNNSNLINYLQKLQSINIQNYQPITSNGRLILINENIHMMNPQFIATSKQQQSEEIFSQQIIPQFVILEQSYFISSDKKQGSDQMKTNKNSIIKMYSNTIKKNSNYRSFINHQYLAQSIAFQERFYCIKTEWKRRGKNQKRKSKVNFDEDSSSLMTI